MKGGCASVRLIVVGLAVALGACATTSEPPAPNFHGYGPPPPPATQPPAPAPPPAPAVEPEAERSRRWADLTAFRWVADGEPRAVPHGGLLHSGDQVAFNVQVQRAAFVCLASVDPRGGVSRLIPCRAQRLLTRGESLRVPSEPGRYLTLDPRAGQERVVVVASGEPIDEAKFDSLVAAICRVDADAAVARARTPAGPHNRVVMGPQHRGLDDVDVEGPYLEVDGGREAVALIRIEHRP